MNLLRPRRIYTKQPRRIYHEGGGYTELAPRRTLWEWLRRVPAEPDKRFYHFRGLSLHTKRGRAFLRSFHALLPQHGAPPHVREYDAQHHAPCIPPLAMRLLMYSKGRVNTDSLAQYFDWMQKRRYAMFLIRLFSMREPVCTVVGLWFLLRRKTRGSLLEACELLRLPDPDHGPGKIASTVTTP